MRTFAFLLLAVSLYLLGAEDIDFKPCVNAMTNGCSIPLGIAFPYKDLFLPACERHDVCYSCGKVYNWTRSHCDKAFRANMMSLCKLKEDSKEGTIAYGVFMDRLKAAFFVVKGMVKWLGLKSESLQHCMNGVDIYYQGVKGFGHGNFDKVGSQFCDLKCAKVIGDPNNLI